MVSGLKNFMSIPSDEPSEKSTKLGDRTFKELFLKVHLNVE